MMKRWLSLSVSLPPRASRLHVRNGTARRWLGRRDRRGLPGFVRAPGRTAEVHVIMVSLGY